MTQSRTATRGVLEVVASIAVIAGVPLFFYQQFSEDRAKGVERAMGFVSMSNTGRIAEVRQKLAEPWLAFDMADFASTRPPAEAIAKMKQDVISVSEINNSDLAEMTDFYSAVISCRNRSICDRTVSDMYFRDAISSFYCLYKERLQETALALNRSSYLDTLKEYVLDCE